MARYLWRVISRSGWSGVLAVIIVGAYVFMIVEHSREGAEILGNLLLAAGALIIGRGVTLEDQRRKWHFDFEEEQKKSPTHYLDVSGVQIQQLWLVQQMVAQIPLQQIESILVAELSKAGYNVAVMPPEAPLKRELTSREISTSLRDASEYGEAGTIVIVAATLWLVALLVYDVFKHYHMLSL
jgi:hypothetical protein